ncbi:capsular polysaccharide synthesis protein [Latilactobacillus curvatus]
MIINILTIVAKVFKRFPSLNKIAYRFNVIRHRIILRKLNKDYGDLINEYRDTSHSPKGSNDIVWVFWWQGIKDAPKIVQSCVSSIRRHLPQGKKLIIIDKHNINNYTDIAQHIYEKLDNGVITYTHFSDIVRFNLLKNNGGLWIDATVYLANDLNEIYFTNRIFTNGPFTDSQYFNVANGQWSGFFFGGEAGNKLFEFMDTFFSNYWEKEVNLIDYFLIDYLLVIAHNNNIGGFYDYLNQRSPQNVGIFRLETALNEDFEITKYKAMLKDTDAFKLNYKKRYNALNNGQITFYGKVINNDL